MNLERRETQRISVWLNKPQNMPALSLFSGSMTGALLILMVQTKFTLLANIPLVLVPYVILVLGFYWLVKRTEVSYLHRFLAGLASFMLATIILYFYIGISVNPKFLLTIPIWAHLWRIGMMLGIAIIVNGVLTYLQYKFEDKFA